MTKPRKVGTRRLHIPITQEVINNAVARDSAHCVVADAIRAAIPEALRVTVDLQTIRWTLPDGTRVVYLTPAPEQALLVNFDQGVVPDPRDMYLNHPIQRVPPRPRHSVTPAVATVTTKKDGHGAGGQVTTVEVEGGRLPPTAALSNTRGRRRSFGLRSLRA